MIDGLRWDPTRSARVRVAASTSNLGPGFDLVGLALSLYLELELRSRPAPGLGLAPGRGSARDWPLDDSNLALRGFRVGCELSDAPTPAAELEAESSIPVSRGLGSSGAAVVAGALLGASVGPRVVEREALLQAAIAIEGHPDNVSPALLGGCVLALPRVGAPPLLARVEPHPSLAYATAWPAATLETKFARSLLPTTVAFADALENPRRLALLIEGLRSADESLIRAGAQDRLHVPYRLPHIPGGRAALDAAHAGGAWLATISGSGSALFAIAPRACIGAVALAMQRELERASPPAEAHVVTLASDAPLVRLV
ncbi:MAG: homoserine kinase [Planctomycetes bacterium]|nr:homoserine kinase [Planctomycetota bacterium]